VSALDDLEAEWALRQHFISYRWETGEHDRWVQAFARGLRARGYPVILDQELMQAPDAPKPSDEQLLRLFEALGTATHFTPIVTPGYSERVLGEHVSNWRDGWVHDEWTIALNMAKERRLIFDGVWRSGPASGIPAPFDEHNVADFRGDDLEGDLDRWYPRFEVNVIGRRGDGTARVVGPILYTEYPQAVELFRADARQFESVAVVPTA
jgi:hypothetical protein